MHVNVKLTHCITKGLFELSCRSISKTKFCIFSSYTQNSWSLMWIIELLFLCLRTSTKSFVWAFFFMFLSLVRSMLYVKDRLRSCVPRHENKSLSPSSPNTDNRKWFTQFFERYISDHRLNRKALPELAADVSIWYVCQATWLTFSVFGKYLVISTCLSLLAQVSVLHFRVQLEQ